MTIIMRMSACETNLQKTSGKVLPASLCSLRGVTAYRGVGLSRACWGKCIWGLHHTRYGVSLLLTPVPGERPYSVCMGVRGDLSASRWRGIPGSKEALK